MTIADTVLNSATDDGKRTKSVQCNGVTYELGDDYLLRISDINIGALEVIDIQENEGNQYYVCIRELPVQKSKRTKILVQNIIKANSMLQAIRKFESDGGTRIWIVEDGNKNTQEQTGVARAASGRIGLDFMVVRIIHVPKQSILGEFECASSLDY